jgi:hypothetical protein
MAKQPKNKFYPLKGEAEMADELNKIERSRPKGYRNGAQEKPLFKKGEISAKRTYEISDSLKRESGLAGVGSALSTLNKNSTRADSVNAYRTGFAKIDAAEKNRKESGRLKLLADSAMNKANAQKSRDMPLPSSDGIMGTITNWFNKK